jgi:hypothetical protein
MKNLIKALLCLIAFTSLSARAQSASTNSIYLEQIGDSSTITLLQKGSGNQMGTAVSPFYMNGNQQILNFTQEGNNNSLQGQILSSSVNSNILNSGNSNLIKLDMGGSASVSGTSFNMNLVGTSNQFELDQGTVGASTSATLTYNLTGDWNTFKNQIDTNNVVNTFNLTGDHNNIGVLQNGMDGKNIDFTLVGSGNSFNIQQKSILNVDSLKIDSISNNGVFNISQCPPLGC